MADAITIDDPRTLRAIAHPVRMQILERFELAGPQRAADIAQALGIPANLASFHLRQLAKYGLVVEAPEEARDGRDRVWKAIDREVRVDSSTLRDVPGGEAALRVFQQRWVGQAHSLLDRIAATEKPDGVMSGAVTNRFLLTREEAGQLLEELGAVVERWRHRADAPADARPYEVLAAISWSDH